MNGRNETGYHGTYLGRFMNMSVRINTLSEEEIRSIGDAFADYEYANSEWGMLMTASMW